MDKHEPGPYTYEPMDESGGRIVTSGGWHVANVYAPGCDAEDERDGEDPAEYARRTHATGRAMAAAPALLAALEEAERVIRWAAQEAAGRVDREKVGGWLYHADKARAALKAATGEGD